MVFACVCKPFAREFETYRGQSRSSQLASLRQALQLRLLSINILHSICSSAVYPECAAPVHRIGHTICISSLVLQSTEHPLLLHTVLSNNNIQ